MSLLKSNWTSWIPLGGYSHSGVDYVIMAAKNRKTGMLRFRTVRVCGNYPWSIMTHSIGVREQINVSEQWQKLINPEE